jgi:lipid kinase YegS
MRDPGRRWLYLLLNARAAADDAVRQAVGELRRVGHQVDVRALWEPGEALRCAAEAASWGCDVIVAAGGDGTLNEVVNGVVSSEMRAAVAVMPYGTANDFSNATGIAALSPQGALKLAAEGTPVPIDVGKCNDRLFVNVASGGFGAEVTATTPRDLKDWLGGLAYTLTGMMKYLTDEERQVHIRTPTEEWTGPLLGFTVANARLAGGGYVVAPKAELDDGLLDLHLIPPGMGEVSDYLERLFGDGFDATVGPSFAVPWAEIESPRELHVNLDGEPVRGAKFRFEVLPKRLPFVLPDVGRGLLARR